MYGVYLSSASQVNNCGKQNSIVCVSTSGLQGKQYQLLTGQDNAENLDPKVFSLRVMLCVMVSGYIQLQLICLL